VNDDEKMFFHVVERLRSLRNPEKVKQGLVAKGMHPVKADEFVDHVHKALKWEIRKGALGKMIGSGVILAIFLLIFAFTGHLFFLIIPITGVGFLWGLGQFIFASGYEVQAESD
jgi:hypothetical protein